MSSLSERNFVFRIERSLNKIPALHIVTSVNPFSFRHVASSHSPVLLSSGGCSFRPRRTQSRCRSGRRSSRAPRRSRGRWSRRCSGCCCCGFGWLCARSANDREPWALSSPACGASSAAATTATAPPYSASPCSPSAWRARLRYRERERERKRLIFAYVETSSLFDSTCC